MSFLNSSPASIESAEESERPYSREVSARTDALLFVASKRNGKRVASATGDLVDLVVREIARRVGSFMYVVLVLATTREH